MRFTRKGGRLEARLEPVEARLLTTMATDLLELLGPGQGADADPLAAMVGLSSGPLEQPDDPALARLLPDAYEDDDAASAEFRRYTEADLRAGKRERASAVLASLVPYEQGGRVPLDREQADAWLGLLNDLRLVLGVRLEVTEETDLEPPGEDPQAQALHVYGWLGAVQESLLTQLVRLPPG
jgi:hypothetical protein